MCRRFAIESLDLFDVLESKLSMSGLVSGPAVAVAVVDDPPPDPEPDPGRPADRRSPDRRSANSARGSRRSRLQQFTLA